MLKTVKEKKGKLSAVCGLPLLLLAYCLHSQPYFTIRKSVATLVQDVDSGEVVHVLEHEVYGNSVFSAQFHYEPKTAQNKTKQTTTCRSLLPPQYLLIPPTAIGLALAYRIYNQWFKTFERTDLQETVAIRQCPQCTVENASIFFHINIIGQED